ncbi:hypothetical protein QJS10_CPB12g00864 [Acorus calamus]|uniref:YTH domain-containing family protein n=1 Tax=Acorus calamus TaxID=4465 RepID=A0AAV9DNC5_ACOCL|nr:hypothetical protein QJS10_CPB12g00864 [Acorus calamus]
METKPVDEMAKNLKIDPSLNPDDLSMVAPKDGGSPSDATSCISSVGDAMSGVKGSDGDQESLVGTEQAVYYPFNGCYGYNYPGFNGSFGGWDYPQAPHHTIQADNGLLACYMPSFPPGYNPYSPVLTGVMVGADGQYLGQQVHTPGSVFPQHLVSPGYFSPPVAYGSDFVQINPWDQSFVVHGAYGNGYVGVLPMPASKPSASTQSHGFTPSKAKHHLKQSNSSVTKGVSTELDALPTHSVQIQKIGSKVPQHGAGFQDASVLTKGYHPVTKFSSYANQGRAVFSIRPAPTSKMVGVSGLVLKSLKQEAKLMAMNHGPRTNSTKSSCVDPAESLDAEDNDKSSSPAVIISRDDYNLPDFPTKYDHAMFFVIKSYSEDDIHKSIKYNVWSSTPSGNKRLDSAYQAAQEKMGEAGSKCPVFLFFSVNASGQFCGVAEMIGHVDFNKNMDFWQQDKWNGFFPVKWHIIKDVPNQQFRHIVLKNNDNKPVTNSRDTQEVKFPQGAEILCLFKNYISKTSILDDFGFYENRQKAMQEKMIKPSTPRVDYLQPKLVKDMPSTKVSEQKTIASSPNMMAPVSQEGRTSGSIQSK